MTKPPAHAPHLLSVEEALAQTADEVTQRYRTYVNPGIVAQMQLVGFNKRFVRAQGTTVYDDRGEPYLDLLGAFGALNLGHNPPEVLQAVQRAMDQPNLLQASLGAAAAALAHNLAALLPGDLSRTFFCNSGAEAVEGALKFARAATGRPVFVYCKGAFHGKSYGALSVTGREKYRAPFQPLLPDTREIPYGDLDALEEALQARDVAAFIVEPIQGEGGVVLPPDGYLREAENLCHQYDTLLIVDEIQTGLGRCGTLFAFEREGIVPDIVCLAKSLGGGVMPIGAFTTTPAIWDQVLGGMERSQLHTSTFGGNTLACVAGIAAINAILDKQLPQHALTIGERLKAGLAQAAATHPELIDEVRGRGLMIGIAFHIPNSDRNRSIGNTLHHLGEEYIGSMVAGELMNRHHMITAYTLNNPAVIRVEPPLILTEQEADDTIAAFSEVLERIKNPLGLAVSSGKTMIATAIGRVVDKAKRNH